ncbi:HlyD family secretion protein [Thalassospira sp.]|uniref:HlyD family secretion protein n=1 Tax=Thalassospira sp. TaxID=1912094 RepID=UPI0027353409|nr:HlyD family secretion protein [Thalassospira sp.]MDP2698054.1 HlyD family secretion protein [Thalassospira sp.]
MTKHPFDDSMVAEVKQADRDAGFVDIGQKARIKVEAFEFTKFGAIDGTVIDVSPDAILDEKPGPVYLAKVGLAQQYNGARTAYTVAAGDDGYSGHPDR